MPGGTFSQGLFREASAQFVRVAELVEVTLRFVKELLCVRNDAPARPILSGVVLRPVAWSDQGAVFRYAAICPYFDEESTGNVTGRSCESLRAVLRFLSRVMDRHQRVANYFEQAGYPPYVLVVLRVVR